MLSYVNKIHSENKGSCMGKQNSMIRKVLNLIRISFCAKHHYKSKYTPYGLPVQYYLSLL